LFLPTVMTILNISTRQIPGLQDTSVTVPMVWMVDELEKIFAAMLKGVPNKQAKLIVDGGHTTAG